MKTLFIAVVALFIFGVNEGRADFMICNGGNIYEGDSQAELAMKCGQPMQVLPMQPQWVTESRGSQASGRWEHMEVAVYPGGSGGYYYVKIKNNLIISISSGPYGTIPK